LIFSPKAARVATFQVHLMSYIKGDYFWFGLVFIKKKITKPNFFFKKTKTGSNRPVSVRFFRTKTGSTGLAQFFLFGSVFSGLARFFSVWLDFGLVFFPVWLSFFSGFFRFGSVLGL
jgi:hypothetical protein